MSSQPEALASRPYDARNLRPTAESTFNLHCIFAGRATSRRQQGLHSKMLMLSTRMLTSIAGLQLRACGWWARSLFAGFGLGVRGVLEFLASKVQGWKMCRRCRHTFQESGQE